jgi:taurine dioxygenase
MIIRPLSGLVCAEVIGFDIDEVSAEVAARLRHALFERLILVIRNQELSVSEQVRLTELFGEPEISWDQRNRHPDNAHVQMVKSSPGTRARKSSSMYWHTDASFCSTPPLVTVLASVELPATGGGTQFADTRSALETLPEPLRRSVRGLHARHSYAHRLRDLQTTRYGRFDRQEEEMFPPVVHPLVRQHPVTGRNSLYLNELCLTGIEEFEPAAGAALLRKLYDYTLDSRFVYQHRWSPGDVLVWDNTSLLHRRASGGYSGGKRVMHRTTCGAQPVLQAAEEM